MSVRDRLTFLPASAASSGAFAAINGLQRVEDPAAQVVGSAAALMALCESVNISTDDALQIIKRMERDCRFREVNTLAAVRAYAREMVGKKLL